MDLLVSYVVLHVPGSQYQYNVLKVVLHAPDLWCGHVIICQLYN